MYNSGIYKIINTVTGNYYIGQAVDFKFRKRNHFNALNRDVHANAHLQNAYRFYGKENFEFKIFLYCEPEELDYYEQYLIHTLDPYYNVKGKKSIPYLNFITYSYAIRKRRIGKLFADLWEEDGYYNPYKPKREKYEFRDFDYARQEIKELSEEYERYLKIMKITDKELGNILKDQNKTEKLVSDISKFFNSEKKLSEKQHLDNIKTEIRFENENNEEKFFYPENEFILFLKTK
jgi:excinuclease UvrABC nuclease subunit